VPQGGAKTTIATSNVDSCLVHSCCRGYRRWCAFDGPTRNELAVAPPPPWYHGGGGSHRLCNGLARTLSAISSSARALRGAATPPLLPPHMCGPTLLRAGPFTAAPPRGRPRGWGCRCRLGRCAVIHGRVSMLCVSHTGLRPGSECTGTKKRCFSRMQNRPPLLPRHSPPNSNHLLPPQSPPQTSKAPCAQAPGCTRPEG